MRARASARARFPLGAVRVPVLLVVGALLLAGCGPGSGAQDKRERGPSAAQAGPLTVVQDDAELLYRSEARVAATLDDLRAAGTDWIRVTAGWSVIAPQPEAGKPPAGFDGADPTAYPPRAWQRLDRLARMTRERGMHLSVDIAFWAPRWAVARPVGDDAGERVAPDPQYFADFAEAVARRLSQAASFTVWNEPNHNVFLLPQWRRTAEGFVPASPDVYRAMLYAAVPRIRAAAPAATVLIGATSSLGASRATEADERMSPMRFLRDLACVDEQLRPRDDGACASFRPLPGDGWSHHPYGGRLPPWEESPEPDDVRVADLGRMADTLDALHAAGRTQERLGMYLTEFGYQTNPPDPTWEVTPDEQARRLAEAERIARADPRVRSVAHFLHRDLPEREGATARERWRDYQTGLVFIDGRPKPARAAFALPLAAAQAAGGRVDLWGLVRPGTGERPWRILARSSAAAPWRELVTGTTAPDGTLSAIAPADAGATFLLEAEVDDRRLSGAPVDGAR